MNNRQMFLDVVKQPYSYFHLYSHYQVQKKTKGEKETKGNKMI